MNTPIEDLFALAKEAIAPVVWTEKKAIQKFKESATPERVLEIEKAFQALEKRAEAAEAKLELVREQRDSELNRNTELEAKLAELERQEHDYVRYDCGCCGFETITECRDNAACPKCNHKPMGKTEIFTRPAPAVSLAELVPDGWQLVPVEPSWEMVSAAIKHHEGDAFLPVSLYKTMLAAASTSYE